MKPRSSDYSSSQSEEEKKREDPFEHVDLEAVKKYYAQRIKGLMEAQCNLN